MKESFSRTCTEGVVSLAILHELLGLGLRNATAVATAATAPGGDVANAIAAIAATALLLGERNYPRFGMNRAAFR